MWLCPDVKYGARSIRVLVKLSVGHSRVVGLFRSTKLRPNGFGTIVLITWPFCVALRYTYLSGLLMVITSVPTRVYTIDLVPFTMGLLQAQWLVAPPRPFVPPFFVSPVAILDILSLICDRIRRIPVLETNPNHTTWITMFPYIFMLVKMGNWLKWIQSSSIVDDVLQSMRLHPLVPRKRMCGLSM